MTNQYASKNRMAPGGDTWIIGGELKRDGAVDGDESLALHVGLPVHYQIAPAAVSATAVHAAITLPDTGTTEVTTAITNPDVPRTVTVKGNQAGIIGNVVIDGTNAAGVVIQDTIALNGASEVEGVKAFKTVTKITVPVKNGAGDTVSVGMAKKFGLPHIVYNAAFLLVKLFNGSADTGTLAVDNDELEKNLFSLNGTPDGSKVLDLVYLK